MLAKYSEDIWRVVIILLALAICSTCNGQARARQQLLTNSTFVIRYNLETHVPDEVSWTLRPSDFSTKRKRDIKYFTSDKRVPKPRVKDAHYTKCGYARGHMCPSADRTASKAMMKETFLMTNVAPMTTKLNSGIWAKIEEKCRGWSLQFDSIRITAACIYLAGDSTYIAKGLIQVPSLFKKEVRVARTDSLIGFWLISQTGDILIDNACRL